MNAAQQLPAREAQVAWAKLIGEPPVAYKRFCRFLELGPGRTLEQLASELPADSRGRAPRLTTLRTQATYWRWPERAARWDEHATSGGYADQRAARAAVERIQAIMVSLRSARTIPPERRDQLLGRANRLLADLQAGWPGL